MKLTNPTQAGFVADGLAEAIESLDSNTDRPNYQI
jgi:hypothetical protein